MDEFANCNYVHNFTNIAYQNDQNSPSSNSHTINNEEPLLASTIFGKNGETKLYAHEAGSEAQISNYIPILSIDDIWKQSVINSINLLQHKLVSVNFLSK